MSTTAHSGTQSTAYDKEINALPSTPSNQNIFSKSVGERGDHWDLGGNSLGILVSFRVSDRPPLCPPSVPCKCPLSSGYSSETFRPDIK